MFLIDFLGETSEAVLNGYSGIYFSRKKGAGLFFLAATFLWPTQAIAGLLCAATAATFSRLIGYNRTLIRQGVYTFNAILVGLAMAYHFPWTPRLFLILILAGVMAALLTSSLQLIFEGIFWLPQFSLGFVLCVFVLSLAQGSPSPEHPTAACTLTGFSLPTSIEAYLKSIAAVFFRNDCAAGLLVLAGLLYSSRIATILSLIGFASGTAVYRLFSHASFPATGMDFIGYNFTVSAIALGGIYCVPSFSSYCLGALAAALCAPVAYATSILLRPYGLDILALPFLVISYVFLAALKMRPLNQKPEFIAFPAASPEENLAVALSRRLRQKDAVQTGLRLPFIGAWQVTQGINGEFTHQDKWRYALDFELPNEEPGGNAIARNHCSDFPAYGLPLVAPQAGVVTRVVDGFPDNVPGNMDTERNWGNYISIRHDDGAYSLLAHLKKGSIRVRPGNRVNVGEILATCGNSGRSPIPHLHCHLQKTAEPGSETLPFNFSSYVRLNGGPTLVEHSLPGNGEIVENLVVSPTLKSAFSLIPGNSYRFDVQNSRARHRETVVAAVDLYGWHYLESTRDRTRLYYHCTPEMFYLNYCSARPGSLLFSFLLAASKVPLVELPHLIWRDELPLNVFFSGPARLAAELIIPFSPGYSVETIRHFLGPEDCGLARAISAQTKQPTIATTISPIAPFSFQKIEAKAVFSASEGPLGIEVRSDSPRLALTATRA